MANSLIVILISLALAYFLGETAKKLGLPRVVGQLSAGFLLGIPSIKNYLFNGNMEAFSFLANLGIILLFYYIGLETDVKVFTRNIRQHITISLLNTLVPAVSGFILLKIFFGLPASASLIVGISLGVSALTVSLDMLEELKLIKSKLGRLMISTGAVDDAVELILIGMFFSIFQVSGGSEGIARLFLEIAIFIILIAGFRIWLIPFSLRLFDREKSSTARFTGALLIVLLIASLAEFLGVGLFIGGLMAGILVRQTILKEEEFPKWEEHDISRSIHIIAFGFLIPLFFVLTGLNVDFSIFFQEFWLVVILTSIAIIGTIVGTVIAVAASGGSLKEGIVLGWGINPKGDVNLAIAMLALSSGMISAKIYTAIVLMAFFTTLISSPVFKYLAVDRLRRAQ